MIKENNIKLNPAEALYGFCAWLTGRSATVKFGSNQDCGAIPQLIEEFMEANNMENVTENWPNNLIHPSGECSQIHSKNQTS